MNLLWIMFITGLSVIAGTSACFWLLSKAGEVHTTSWVLQRVICGSIQLVSEAIFPVLQIPVMLIYCGFLKQQLV